MTRFRLFVLSADRKLDSGRDQAALRGEETPFATPEELMELTGPGTRARCRRSGTPILPFPLYVDPSVFENKRMAFNAGSLTDSIVMAAHDYRRLAAPKYSFSHLTRLCQQADCGAEHS